MTLHYQITVKEYLEDSWSGWFDGLTISHAPDGATLRTRAVRDQTALYVPRLMYPLSAIRLLTHLLHPAVEPFATARTTSVARHVGLAAVLAALVVGLGTARGQRALWQDTGEPIAEPPRNDTGAVRTLGWTALRVRHRFSHAHSTSSCRA